MPMFRVNHLKVGKFRKGQIVDSNSFGDKKVDLGRLIRLGAISQVGESEAEGLEPAQPPEQRTEGSEGDEGGSGSPPDSENAGDASDASDTGENEAETGSETGEGDITQTANRRRRGRH